MDGQIDYSGYSLHDLEQALKSIDPVRFPGNYENLQRAIDHAKAHPVRYGPPTRPPAPPAPLLSFLFSFKGRVSRREYWLRYVLLIELPALIVGLIIDIRTGALLHHYPRPDNFVLLVILWPSLAVQAKRWHDRDKSGWWILINYVPIIGSLWAFIENGFLSGTEGENRYGPDRFL